MKYLQVKNNTIDDYIGWIKLIISFTILIITSFSFKFLEHATRVPEPIKWGTLALLISLILHIVFYAGLIEHKDSNNEDTPNAVAFCLFFGFMSFVVGLGCISYPVWKFW